MQNFRILGRKLNTGREEREKNAVYTTFHLQRPRGARTLLGPSSLSRETISEFDCPSEAWVSVLLLTWTDYSNIQIKKYQISFSDTVKGHSPFSTQIGFVYTLLFVVTSAHTLLGHWNLYLFILIYTCGSNTLLGPVVQLYCQNVIQSVYTCTAFCCY